MCKTQHLNSSCVWLYYENTIQGFIGSSKSDCSNKLGDSRFVWNQFLNWFLIWTAFIIMNIREKARLQKIEQVLNNIKRAKGKFDRKTFLIDIMTSQEVSERKAKEYLMIAEYQYNGRN